MNDRRWVQISSTSAVPPREGRMVMIGQHDIALFNLGDRFAALDNRCPHQGGPLCDGIVAGTAVVCPLHGWKVNVETGAVDRPGGTLACVPTHPTRVEGGVVHVALPVAWLTERKDMTA